MSTDRITEWLGNEPWVGSLHTSFPKFAEGLARIGDVIHGDSALSAAHKAMFVAATVAVKRDVTLAEQYAARAVELGLTADEVWGAGINVLISRGVVPHRIFVDAFALAGVRPAAEATPFTERVSMDEILTYYKDLYQDVPPNVALGAEHRPPVIEGYYLMRRAALDEAPLEGRLADLMLVTVNAAEYEELFVEIHARFAIAKGASVEQLVEAVACAVPFAGIAAWLPGANGIIKALEGN